MKNISLTTSEDKSLSVLTLNETNFVDIYVTEISKRYLKKDLKNLYNPKTFRFYYIASGQSEIKTDSISFNCSKNILALLLPNHQYDITVSEDSVLYTLDFMGIKASEYTERMGFLSDLPFLPLLHENDLSKNFLKCMKECTQKPYASDIIALNFFYGLVKSFVFNNYDRSDIEAPCKELYVKKAIQYINMNYSNPEISLNSVAAYLNISPSYFSRIFKSILKTTFKKYLNYKRLKVAASLMAQGETSIKIIAESVGFSNQLYFSSIWKKYNKISPTDHLNKIQ